MASLYRNPKYQACVSHASEWCKSFAEPYKTLMCLKPMISRRKDETVREAFGKIKDRVEETYEDVLSKHQEFLCVLPIGHSGKCTHKPHTSFVTRKPISAKLDYIYVTTGDDDYIYKNRCNRLFPILVADETEKDWRDKTMKLRCAIPVREASTPLMMAAAYLDYLTLILSVEGIYTHIDTSYPHLSDIQAITDIHAVSLSDYYKTFNRSIFDSERYTICPVTTERIEVEYLADNEIKNPKSVQLGHVVPRSETEFTVRGKNLLLMTREGNRILGDHVFTEDVWLTRLRKVLQGHSL